MKKNKWLSVLLAVVLLLSAVCGVAAETAVGTDELLGSWIIVEVSVDDETEDTLAAAIKPFFDQGSEFLMVFSEDQVSIEITNGDDPMKDVAPFSAEGNLLYLGEMEMEYALLDGQLLLSSGSDLIVLDRQGEDLLDGTAWEMIAFTGVGPDQMTMAFENGVCTASYTFGDVTDTAETAYTYNGKILVMNNTEATAVIVGDILTITDPDATMTLQRIPENSDPLDGTAWEMTDFTGNGPDSLSIRFENGVCHTEIRIGENVSATDTAYTFEGNVLKMNNSEGVVVMDGEIMTVTEGRDTMTFRQIHENADPLDGTTWEMTDFTGSGFSSWTMTFKDGICSITYLSTGMTVSQTQQAVYAFDGSTLSMNGSDADVTIQGDIMTITDQGETMTLRRK